MGWGVRVSLRASRLIPMDPEVNDHVSPSDHQY
jgi:hypothetical protein